MLNYELHCGAAGRAPGASLDIVALLEARDLFDALQRRGALRRAWEALRGRPSRLVPLHAVTNRSFPRSTHLLGQQQVAIAQIIGSENRDGDFDRRFAPISDHLRERWVGVAMAWQRVTALPPVDLIQVGDVFYVRDGHHRISVARAFGATSIDANVEVWQVATAPQAAPATLACAPGRSM